MVAAAGSGADASSATPQTLAALSRAGILDVRHLIAASGAVSGAVGGEGAESKEADSAAGGAAAAGVLFDTLASQEALQAMVTSPAASEPLTHVAVGFASHGHGAGARAAVCVALLDRTASVIGAGDTGAQLLRAPGASAAAAVAVYRDELAEAGAGVVTLQLRPDAEASAAARPALGARLVLLRLGAASALAVAGEPQALPAVPATVQDEEAHISLDQVVACWQRIRVAPLEDASGDADGATAGPAASGFAEAFDGSGSAFVWPWQVNCHGDDAISDVEVPLAVPLLEAAASSAGGAGGASPDEPLATVLVQLVGDASGGPGAANVDEADESFPVARLRPRRPLGAGAGAGDGESVSSAVIAVHIFASRPPSHPPRSDLSSAALGSAVALDDAPAGAAASAAAGGGSAVRSRRSSAGAGAGSAAGKPLPDGFAAPAERPAVSGEAHAAAPLQSVGLSAVPGGSSSSSSAAATMKPQHMGFDGSRAPLTTLLPQSLLLAFSDAAAAAAGGAGDESSSSAPISRLMLVSGSSEADALASAPEGFELLPGNLADAVKHSLAAAGGDAGAAGGAGGAGAGSEASTVVTVYPAAVYIAVQRVGAPGSLGGASPLVDAGLVVVAGVTAASASAAAYAAGADSSSDAGGAGSGLLLPSVTAPAGYSLQMKDVVLTREADTASSSAAAGAGEGKEGDAEGKEGEASSSAASPAAARAAVRIVLLSTADAGAVEAAVRASAGSAAPLAVPVSDHPAAAAALGGPASAAAAGGAGSSRAGSAGRSGPAAPGRPHMQIEADGVVGSAGEDATSAVPPPPPPPAPLVAGSRAGSRPTSGGGPPRPPGHLALKMLGEKAAAGGPGGAGGGAGAGDDEGDELAALGGGQARGAGAGGAGAGGAGAAGGRGAAAGGAGAGRGGGGGAREDKHRQQLVELLAAALAQQQQLAAANATLHRQLTTYFSLRQGEGEGGAAGAPGAAAAAAAAVAAATGGGGGGPGSKSAAAAAFAAADKERRYREQLDGAATDRERLAAVTAQGERDATELQLRVEEREAKAEQLSAAFADFKHQIAAAAVNSHTGRRIPADELDRAEALEREKDGDVAKVQLRHVHLAAQVAKLENSLRKREQVADGLALMDFEQLKIENATLTEKIEDRNEELAKLKKKAAVAVQILTHVREKLHFVQAEAGRLGSELAALEAEVSEQRALLALAKKERELARAEAERAAHAQGFAHADRLAIDFERRKRDIVACRDALDATHARLARLHEVAAERTALLTTAMSAYGAAGKGGFGGIGSAGSTASSLSGFAGGASAGSRAFAASSAGTHGTGAASGASRRPPVPVPTGHAPPSALRAGAGGSAATLSGGIRAGLSAGVSSSGGSLKR